MAFGETMTNTRPPILDVNVNQGGFNVGPLPNKAPVAAFATGVFDSLVETKGVEAVHYISAPLPNRQTMEGGVNPNDLESTLGRRYFEARKLLIIVQSIPLEQKLQVLGIYGAGTITLNVDGRYLDGDQEQVYCSTGDLIRLNPTITSMEKQLIEYNPNGPNTLNFMALGVKYLASEKVVFTADEDFTVMNGAICWLQGGKRPKVFTQPDGRVQGEVLTCVYWMSPIYVVRDVPHHLRLLPSNPSGYGGAPRELEYGPQLVIGTQLFNREQPIPVDLSLLPSYPGYPVSRNTTGG